MNRQKEHFDKYRLNQIPITEVARKLGCNLHRSGSLMLTNCLWHEDKHPSLALYYRTGENHCYCFVCKTSKSVISFVMQKAGFSFQDACRWLSQEFGISTTSVPMYVPKRKTYDPEVSDGPVVYIPSETLERMESADSTLCQCLKHLFRPEAVDWVAEEYRLGLFNMYGLEGCTVFPCIDVNGRVCNLKVQYYDTDPSSPRFGHSEKKFCYWIGKMLVRDRLMREKGRLRSDCLFGEHLLNRYPLAQIALVESPKNALYGALAMPRLLWIATGNKGNLKKEALLPLKGRQVIVIPDADALEEWEKVIGGLADLANFTISDFCRRHAPDGNQNYDIADYIQQERLKRNQARQDD